MICVSQRTKLLKWRRPLTKAQLPATCILSEGVRSRHDCFYMCSNEKCQKIYWQVSEVHFTAPQMYSVGHVTHVVNKNLLFSEMHTRQT